MIELNFRATPLLKSHKQLDCTNCAQISEIWCNINYSVVVTSGAEGHRKDLSLHRFQVHKALKEKVVDMHVYKVGHKE